MEKKKILIVESEMVIAGQLTNFLGQQGYDVIDCVISGYEAVKSVNENLIDIILIDLEIAGELDGIQTALEIKQLKNIPIFFLTNFPIIKLRQAHDFNPQFHFLDQLNGVENGNLTFGKPSEVPAVSNIMNEHWDKIENGHYSFYKDVIFVKNDYKYQKISISDVLWVEADRSYCKLVTTKEQFLLSINLNTFDKLIESPSIVRVHRSFMINIDKIDSFEGNCLYIKDNTIPIGAKFKHQLIKVFPYINRSGIILN